MKRTLILTILVALALITGCDGTGTTGSQTPFIGGSNGLIESFVPQMPPEEVFDNGQQPFSIAVQLENMGESNIAEGAGYVRVLGILPADYGVTAADLKQDIPEMSGAKKNVDGTILTGGVSNVEFSDLSFIRGVPGPFETGTIRAEACYDYETYAAAQLCVKEKLTTEEERQLCDPSKIQEISNSGAPIHVTNLIETPLQQGRKIQFSFQIEPVGQENDRFYKYGTNCNDDLTNNDRYKVFVEVEDISGVKPVCRLDSKVSDSSGYKTLWNGAPQTVSCDVDFGTTGTSFMPLLNVKLKYRYSQYIDTGMTINHMPIDDEETVTTTSTTIAATTTTAPATTTSTTVPATTTTLTQ